MILLFKILKIALVKVWVFFWHYKDQTFLTLVLFNLSYLISEPQNENKTTQHPVRWDIIQHPGWQLTIIESVTRPCTAQSWSGRSQKYEISHSFSSWSQAKNGELCEIFMLKLETPSHHHDGMMNVILSHLIVQLRTGPDIILAKMLILQTPVCWVL